MNNTAEGTYCCPICTRDTPHTHSKDYWIGVDFDGTLAYTIPNRISPYDLGEPIPDMVNRVKNWIAMGYTVKLMTARMNLRSSTGCTRDLDEMEAKLHGWCLRHIGAILPCVNNKDGWMEVLWDDRAVSVIKDTGNPVIATKPEQWLPIESAPKDGTPIMGCTWIPSLPHLYSPRRIFWSAYHPNASGKVMWRDSDICGNKLDRLTHWMPLMLPPEPETPAVIPYEGTKQQMESDEQFITETTKAFREALRGVRHTSR
jgi:hypothetical protein